MQQEHQVKVNTCPPLAPYPSNPDYLRRDPISESCMGATRPDPSPLQDYVLLKDIDWFGRIIPAGTTYRQVNADNWHPMLNYARCPSLQIDFYTVLNNPNYFLKLMK